MSFFAQDVKSVACRVIEYLLKQLWAFLGELVPDVLKSFIFYGRVKWDYIFFPEFLVVILIYYYVHQVLLGLNNCSLRGFYVTCLNVRACKQWGFMGIFVCVCLGRGGIALIRRLLWVPCSHSSWWVGCCSFSSSWWWRVTLFAC